MNLKDTKNDIEELKKDWQARSQKFMEWMDMLNLEDKLKKSGLESYVSSDPRSNYNMGQYLLTAGGMRHMIPLVGDSPEEMDNQARVERACQYMWRMIDEDRRRGGAPTFSSELVFDLLILGWYSVIAKYDSESGKLIPKLWSPANTFPRFDDNCLSAVVHSYDISVQAAKRKAKMYGWNYSTTQDLGITTIDNYFYFDEDGNLMNQIFVGGNPVTEWIERNDHMVMVSPVGGFPEHGEINSSQRTMRWRGMVGQGIMEASRMAEEQWNKFFTFQMQLVRDTAVPVSQEFSSGSAKVKPEQLNKRGAHFQFSPTDKGLEYVPKPPIPLEVQATLQELKRDKQRTGFSDALFGLLEQGLSGVTYTAVEEASANHVLQPYKEAKDFVISELDRFWLRNLKSQGKSFTIKGKAQEVLKSKAIPEDVDILVESELATTKDWLERATIANMMGQQVDSTTIMEEIYKFTDTQDIKRRKRLDLATDHPMSINLELANAYEDYAQYLERSGDQKKAQRFRQAAQALDAQLGAPPPGQAQPAQFSEAEAARQEGAPQERTPVPRELGNAPQRRIQTG
jgi:hypothetical protein